MRQRDIARAELREQRKKEKVFRPRAFPFVIDWEKIQQMLRTGLNGIQISNILGFHEDTLYERCVIENRTEWSTYKRRYADEGIQEIVTAQHELAVKDKDKTMLVWLGKCRAGQYEAAINIQNNNEPLALKFFKEVCKKELDKSEDS